MSWSLQLRNGDFQVNGASLGVVTHQRKLIQDLRCALLEKMGTDNLHPTFGSLIDGGRTPDGVEVAGVIGESQVDLVVLEVESEIARIVRAHQRSQLSRAKQDKLTYGRATLDPQEVLIDLGGVDFQQFEDTLFVTIHLTTATGDSFSIEIPVEADLEGVDLET